MSNTTARPGFAVGVVPGLFVLILALFFLATPSRADAQVTGHWDCRSSNQCAVVMGGASGDRSFSTAEECQAWREYVGTPSLTTCSGGGSRGGGIMCLSCAFTGNPVEVAFASGVFGGFVGGVLIGGFIPQAGDTAERQWEVGALGLTSLLLSGATLHNNWNLFAKGFMGAVGGGLGGRAAGIYADQSTGAAGTPDSKVTPYTEIGAASVATIAIVAGSLDLNQIPILRRVNRKSNPVQLINTGRRMGMRIEW